LARRLPWLLVSLNVIPGERHCYSRAMTPEKGDRRLGRLRFNPILTFLLLGSVKKTYVAQ